MKLVEQRTRTAFIWTNIFKAPFWTLYNLLVFILYKDLHASSLQVAIFLALKPAVSVFSIYWSSFINNRRDRLVLNIIAAGIIGYLPFFFFPWVSNPWFFIFAGALYMMLTRGVVPAWMEILKINLPNSSREKVFSYGSAISYLGGILLPLLIGDLLDIKPGLWRWLFPLTACLSLGSLFFQLRIPIDLNTFPLPQEMKKTHWLKQIVQPWKNVWNLLYQRDFREFQIGFFLGGMGLIIIQPALPQFFFDALHLSYAELTVALSACKGIGFALTTPFWSSLIKKINIFRFSSLVTALAALSLVCLLCAQSQFFWLYISYLIYGIMQAGSELSWHLSGPIFSKNEDSSVFSSVNVVTVGLRGCIAPFLGSLLCAQFSPRTTLIVGALFSSLAVLQMSRYNRLLTRKGAAQ
jgi:MFS family permease